MSIQSGINQILSSAGVMSSLGRQAYQQSNRYQGKQYQQQFEGSKRSLYDIYQNLKKPMDEKSYSETELNDIAARHRALNKSIYDVKVAELDPRYKGRINTSSLKQTQLSELNKEMEAAIADRRAALNATKTPQEPLGEVPVHPEKQPLQAHQTMLPARQNVPLIPEQVAIPQGPITSTPDERLQSINNDIYKLEKQQFIKERMATRKAESSLLDNAQSKLDTQRKEPLDIDLPAPTTNETENVANMSLTNRKQNKIDSKKRLKDLKDDVEDKDPFDGDPLFTGVQLAERGNINNKSKVGNTQIFTKQREVNKMVDLIDKEGQVKDFNRTILEPTSGEGAFTTNILGRRINHALNTYTNEKDFLKNTAKAISTLYSIEPMGDTHATQVKNLKTILNNGIKEFEKRNNITIDKNSPEYKEWKNMVDTIVDTNIIHGYFGDTLEKIAKSKGKTMVDSNKIGYFAKKDSSIDYEKPIDDNAIIDYRNHNYFKEDKDGTEK